MPAIANDESFQAPEFAEKASKEQSARLLLKQHHESDAYKQLLTQYLRQGIPAGDNSILLHFSAWPTAALLPHS